MGWLRSTLDRLAGGSREPAQPRIPPAGWKAAGNAALAAGDLAEAERCYQQGAAAEPQDGSMRLNLGYVLLEQGRHAEAVNWLLDAIALHGAADDFLHDAHFLLGRAQAGLGTPDEALASFEAATRARADFAQPLEEAVRLCHQQGDHAAAATWARRLLALRPSPFMRQLLATELMESGQPAEAADLLVQVLAEAPGQLDAGVLRLRALMQLERFEDALAQAQQLLEQASPDAGLLVQMAVALEKLNRLDEALLRVDEALALAPTDASAHFNRVVILMAQGRVDDALAAAATGLALHPEHADLHWFRSFALLLRGNFREGWQEHEWRIRSKSYTGWAGAPADRRWQGESLQGKTLLVYAEQGFGDTLQFVRHVAQVAASARQVLLAVPVELEPLLDRLAPNCRLLPQGSQVPAFDHHCALMSLPHLLDTRLETIPAAVPYLHADPAKLAAWRQRLPRDTLNVGIAWSGRATQANDRNRSTTLAALRPLQVPGCRFFTIQPQLRDEDRQELARWPEAEDVGRELRSFADTAALLGALDLVISVDTSVVHLAGALARPVWILAVDPPDWRWLEHTAISPWYPTARLYRQPSPGAWAPVIERVAGDLARLAAQAR